MKTNMKISLFLLFSMILFQSSHITLAFRSIGISFSRTIINGAIYNEKIQNNNLRLSLSSKEDQNEPTKTPTNTATIEKNDDVAADDDQSQVLATGFSQNMDMVEALREAVEMAIAGLPPPLDLSTSSASGQHHHRLGIDLAVVSVSSLYDGNASPSLVVPTILEAASSYETGIQHLVGSTCGGFIGSTRTAVTTSSSSNDDDDDTNGDVSKNQNVIRACQPVEREGVPGVSVVLCILPDVQLRTFHVTGKDVPEDYGTMSPEIWKESVGLSSSSSSTEKNENENEPVVLVLPSPTMKKQLADLLRGTETHLPGCKIFGSVASVVSSLSRARLFRYDATKNEEIEVSVVQTLADGCVGVVMEGDITLQTMIAQGAKPVGGVYQIVKGEKSTISAIALDETATELFKLAEEEDDDDDRVGDDEDNDERASKLAAAYAKARIPKPVLAEANFVMKTLSDDDETFMRKTILIGVERSRSLGGSSSELARLAEGKNRGYSVHIVENASMKDGSVSFALGSVDIEQGTRMRFFVRESDFAKKEIEALWMGYKKRSLESIIAGQDADNSPPPPPPPPTGCFVFPTLDRGSKLFSGKSGYESSAISEFLPTTPCISGFFGNGVIGSMNSSPELPKAKHDPATMNDSASGYFLIGSKSGRPIFTPKRSVGHDAQADGEDLEESDLAMEEKARQERAKSFDTEKKAPRDENGELILKRREIHSGRALTVSTVEWSVAENMAKPTSILEGFMWDKETEVDRFRERVPLANLLSQWKLSLTDPSTPKPRDWIGPIKKGAAKNGFVIVPECKRTEPTSGSLRKRYNVQNLIKDFTMKGARAISVNCDGILFGGSLEDLTTALETSSADDGVVVPPILASDLLLYPYQLYKMRLAGADAVNLVVGALENKDLVYLTKIASSLKMQSLLIVTSTTQVKNLDVLAANSISGLIVSNREVSR
jgi:indole-3-glycerol phosphate synthase